MAKIAFVYPVSESLGVEYISSCLRKKGHEVSLFFDPRILQDEYSLFGRKYLSSLAVKYEDKLVKDILAYRPDIVAFSVVTDYYTWALAFAAKVKMVLPGTPLIFGGIHVSSTPELVIRKPEVDIVCVGEGEDAMIELVDSLPEYRRNKNLKIMNLWFKDGDKVYKNEPRSLVDNLDTLPFPDHDIFYGALPAFRLQYNIISGRGCPFKCTYCCNNFLSNLYLGNGKYLRRRSVDNVISELKYAKGKYYPPYIFFRDEVFAYDINWVREFSKRYKKEIGIPFRCYAHPALLSEEMISELGNAGCVYIAMGIQTINENSRRNVLHRPESNYKIEAVIGYMHKAGITLNVDHIAGIPGEGEEEMREAARFYGRVRPDVITYFWLTLYPGTEMIKIFKERGLVTNEEIQKTMDGLGSSDFLGGNVKHNYEIFRQFRTFLSYLPLIPRPLVDFILDKRLYRYMGMNSLFLSSLFPRLLKLPFNNDLRSWIAEIRYVIGRMMLVLKRSLKKK